MSNDNNANEQRASVQATIDAMVARAEVTGARISMGQMQRPEPSKEVHSHEGFDELDTQLSQVMSGERPAAPGRVHDDGRSIEGTYNQLAERWAGMRKALDEVVFDRKTGARTYALQGEERRKAELEFAQFDRSMKYEVGVLRHLEAQRAADELARQEAQANEVQRRQNIEAEAVRLADEEEARARAAQILAERRQARGF